jgi:hypothetical protein
MNYENIIQSWPTESKEAAELVIESRGEPDEVSETKLIWHNVSPLKRIVANKKFKKHNFPAPHIDAVESVIAYDVPLEKVSQLASYDGSVTYRRTAGELSAECHDEQANFLALNLANDIIEGNKTIGEARTYYSKEFLDSRRGKPAPYMEKLRFSPTGSPNPDERTISDDEIQTAMSEKNNM